MQSHLISPSADQILDRVIYSWFAYFMAKFDQIYQMLLKRIVIGQASSFP